MNLPLDEHSQTIERMFSLRGRVLAYYAAVEFILADLVVRCRDLREYQSLNLSFPVSMAARLRAAKSILLVPGPFQSGAELLALLDRLVRHETMRHDLAHGFAQTFTTSDQRVYLIQIRRWEPRSNGHYALRQRSIVPHEFELEVDAIASDVSAAMTALMELYRGNGIDLFPGSGAEVQKSWPVPGERRR